MEAERLEQQVKESTQTVKNSVVDAANDLVAESKRLANELYSEGFVKAGEQVKHYSGLVTKTISERPLTSLVIAGTIGFVLSKVINIKK